MGIGGMGQQAPPPELGPEQIIRSMGDEDLFALRAVANATAGGQEGLPVRIPTFVQESLEKNPVAKRIAQSMMTDPAAREQFAPLVRQRMAEAGIGEMGAEFGVPRSDAPSGKRARARTGLLGGRISALGDRDVRGLLSEIGRGQR